MYTTENFKSKRAFKEAVARSLQADNPGPAVTLFATGPRSPAVDGIEYVSGPHYHPKPHSWYAEVTMAGGKVVKVK